MEWFKKLNNGTEQCRWVVTGVAGFIGSHLAEFLLKNNQLVIGLDNFSTGSKENINLLLNEVGSNSSNFTMVEGDIRDFSVCTKVTQGSQYVLHQAALGSVPRSIAEPLNSHASNVDGFINMLTAAKDASVRTFVYASSSSVYGDSAQLPKVEQNIGDPLSPYAVTKLINEIYAKNYSRVYGIKTVGLRYFNVFGPRQSPNGPYAAVIPKWIEAVRSGDQCVINGDGETSRDFCYIDNVVQANILAAITSSNSEPVFNVGVGDQTTLNQLLSIIQEFCVLNSVQKISPPVYKEFREGDVRHSLASINKISNSLGFKPTHTVNEGLEKTVSWFFRV